MLRATTPKLLLPVTLLLQYSLWFYSYQAAIMLVDAKKQSSHVVNQLIKTTLLDFNYDPSLLSKDELEFLDDALIQAYENVFHENDNFVILDVDADGDAIIGIGGNVEEEEDNSDLENRDKVGGQFDDEEAGGAGGEGNRQLRSSIRHTLKNSNRLLAKASKQPKYKDYDYRQKGQWYCRLCWDDWGYRRHRQLFHDVMNDKTQEKSLNARNTRRYDDRGLILQEDSSSKAHQESDNSPMTTNHQTRKERLEKTLASILKNGPYPVFHDISACRIDFI